MKELNVLYICDDVFAPIAGVSLTSLFENNSNTQISITVYLLWVGVSSRNRELFLQLAEKYGQTIHLIDAEPLMQKICSLNLSTYRGSAMTNLRLYFDLLIPDSVHRLLYLDCDTLVCAPVSELADLDLKGRTLGMILDAYGSPEAAVNITDTPYYNAGVILIDCNRWRTGNWGAKIETYLRTGDEHLSHPDQDLLNLLCRSEILRLPVRYNLQTIHRMYSNQIYFKCFPCKDYYSEQEINEAIASPAILHMIRVFGENPWNFGSHHPDEELFLRYKNISLWNSWSTGSGRDDPLLRIERILFFLLLPSIFLPLSVRAIRWIQKFDRKNNY